MYVALFPCNECTKLIIQSGIKEIVYYSDKYHNEWQVRPFLFTSLTFYKFTASRKMLDLAGIKYWQHTPKQQQIVIDFTTVDK